MMAPDGYDEGNTSMSEKLGLTADEVLTTTRSVRKRLDFDRPVEREVIEECIEIAHQAPTGSNMQGWQWMVVTDDDKKLAIADFYRTSFTPYIEAGQANPDRATGDAVLSSATYLAENFEKAPMMVIPLHIGRMDAGLDTFGQASMWGSILPAVWSFMLALRERGLGSAWTTLHLPHEAEVAELLGIPAGEWTQAGLFPVAYTKGTDFKLAKRPPASDYIHWDTW